MHEGHRERLRARYIKTGLSGFADHEVLELLLTYAIPRQDTNATAHALLSRFGSLRGVLYADINELQQVHGVGERTAVLLHVQGELLHDLSLRVQIKEKAVLSTPVAMASLALNLLGKERYESVYVVSLDKHFRLLHAQCLFSGTLYEAPMYPRRIVETVLQHQAYAALLLHNHPSGDPAPSEADISATAAVIAALNGVDMQLYDHIIVGRDIVYSCARNLYINKEGTIVAEGSDSYNQKALLQSQRLLSLAAAEKKV